MRDDFHREDAAESVGERGKFQAGQPVVRDDNGVAAQFPDVLFEKVFEMFAADFLLAFDDEGEIAGQRSAGLQVGFDGVEMGEMLALVIDGATGKERAALDARLERRRFPKVERLGRLHVVVAVHHKVRSGRAACFRPRRLGDDNGVAFGRAEARLEANLAAVAQQPLGAGGEILLVLGLGGHAGEAQVFAQFADEACFVLLEVIENRLHGAVCSSGGGGRQMLNDKW